MARRSGSTGRSGWRRSSEMRCARVAALLLAVLLTSPSPAAEPLATDLREQVVRLPIKLEDYERRQKTEDILLTTFRPQGKGPFPIAVLSHGRLADQRKGERMRMEAQARYFVRNQFLVVVPTRVGYGP